MHNGPALIERQFRVLALLLIAPGLAPGHALGADEAAEAASADDPTPQLCVLLRNIRNTDIIDDRNIIFYMRGGDIYRNQLPYRCPGLRIADSFIYRTSLNVLCNVDLIAPLRNIGGGLTPGVSCALGKFTPITKEEIALLRNKDVEPDNEAVAAEVERDVETDVD